MKVGDLIRWRSTGVKGVIISIEDVREAGHAYGDVFHILCGADEDGDGEGMQAFFREHVEKRAEVISASR